MPIDGYVDVVDAKEIYGWVSNSGDSGPIKVTLYVNDIECAATWAIEPIDGSSSGNARRFRFGIRDIWKFMPSFGAMTIRALGEKLPMRGPSDAVVQMPFGSRSVRVLKKRLQDGYVFNQHGKLRLSKKVDFEWQKKTMALHGRVAAAVKEITGYDIFLCYGTLLGFVREGGLIGHDVDFDCAYVSQHTSGREAASELRDLALELIKRGFKIKCKKSCFDVTDDEGEGTYVDLFHTYFQEDGTLGFPFAVGGTSTITRADMTGVEQVKFLGFDASVPVPTERFVEHLYGPNWRTPNPGFTWNNARTNRASEGVLTEAMVNEVYWANFYAHASYDQGSSFCEYILTQNYLPSTVIDIGCGDGRDAIAFAKAGRQVLGLDRSAVGVEHAGNSAAHLGLADKAKFSVTDVANGEDVAEKIRGLRASASGGPVLFYTRFFLHSITEDVQNTLLGAISGNALSGDYLVAEFRTDKDSAKLKVHGDHFRRYQNGDAFAKSLGLEFGFTVLVKQEGNGFSPYKNEDPELCRVISKR